MIQIRIQDESELYNRFDPSQERISEDVYRYLKSYCTGLRSQEHSMDVIRIISDKAIDADHFRTCVRNAARIDCEEFDCQISKNNRLALWEFIMGILLSKDQSGYQAAQETAGSVFHFRTGSRQY